MGILNVTPDSFSDAHLHDAIEHGHRLIASTVGIVDVPGHERFVKTMVAGATGIDMVLLVIAADRYASRPFLYLDIISWLDSKIAGVPVQEIMQRKFRLMK